MERRRRSEVLLRRGPELVVSAVSLWASAPFWMQGGTVTSYDGATYSMPNTVVTRTAVRSGRVPFVNDLIFGGAPHLGNHAVGVFYPPRFIALVLDTARAHGLVVAAHLVFLGIGMVTLGRRLGLSRLGMVAAGIMSVLAGATLTKSIQYEQIQPVAWLPWMVIAVMAVGRRGSPRRPVGVLAFVTALTILSGHPQLVFEVGVATAVIAIAAIVSRRISIGRMITGVLLGVGAAGVQVVATIAATQSGALEQGRTLDDLANGSYILQVRSSARALFGTILDRDPAGFSGAFESILWIGVVASLLVVVGTAGGLASDRHRWWSIPSAVIIVVGVVWSLGPRTPLFRVAYDWLPGFDLGRVSSRWLVIVALFSALLAGLGIDVMHSRWSRRQTSLAAVMLAGSVAIVAVGPFVGDEQIVGVIWLATVMAVVTVAMAVPLRHRSMGVLLLMTLELALLASHSLPGRLRIDEEVGASPSPAIAELQQLSTTGGLTVALTPDAGSHPDLVRWLRPNANVWFGLRSIDGYDGGVQVTQMWADALRRFTAEPALDMPLRNALSAPVSTSAMARLGVRWMVVGRDRDPAAWVPDWSGPVAADDLVTVWENPRWVGDAVAWYDSAESFAHPADELRTMAAALGSTALVVGQPVSCDRSCDPTPLNLDRRSPEHLVVTGSVGAQAVVVVPVQALPGWRVSVDGMSQPVTVVDGLFLGVVVSSGNHEVEFRYRPAWWWPSVLLSMSSLAVVVVLTVDRRRRRLTS